MNHRTSVLEYSSPKALFKDQEGRLNGCIKGVKIIGKRSKNGYIYQPDALKAAIPLYENSPVFIMHGSPKSDSRKFRDHFGSLQSIREKQNGDALYGDLLVKMSHPMARSVIEWADKGKFGLSHNAVVVMNEEGTEVTKILEINSVDLVDDPATTQNLFEEETMSKEFQDELFERLDKIEEKISTLEPKPVTEEIKPPPKRRIEAFEEIMPVEGDPAALQIGNTHDDFLGALRGFPVTN